jgi:hypothetical protein
VVLVDFPALELAPVVTRRQTLDHDWRKTGCRFAAQNTNRDPRSLLPDALALVKAPTDNPVPS